METLSLFEGRPDDPQRGSPIHHCQGPGIAMMNDRIPIGDQIGSVFSHSFIDFHVFIRQVLVALHTSTRNWARLKRLEPFRVASITLSTAQARFTAVGRADFKWAPAAFKSASR